MDIKSILLVGVGNIGFRHFQSLCNLAIPCNVILVDTNEKSLANAKEYARSISGLIINIFYENEINNINENIDIAIIATSSLVRKAVFEKLVSRVNVKNIIFEKFLFPTLNEYDSVKKILTTKKINAFVNTPGRLFPGYIDLKRKLNDPKHLDVFMYGSNWGLSCNAIHIIDQIAFLLSSYDSLQVDATMLDNCILESKRSGYIEFTGKLICHLGKKADIILCSDSTGNTVSTITIFAEDAIYTISETEQKLLLSNDCKTIELKFPTYYQSQLTSMVVNDLLETGTCGLTHYNDTIQWHKSLLSAFLRKYEEILGYNKNSCPIT